MLYISESDVKQITKEEALHLPKGSLLIVRSNYKYEIYDDHPALILGGTIKKERGLRPNLLTFSHKTIVNIRALLNQYDPIDGITLLLIKKEIADKFMQRHEIHLSEGELMEVELLNNLNNILNS